MTMVKHVMARLRAVLEPKGLDVLIPLTLEQYNRHLLQQNATKYGPFLLPVPAKTKEEDEQPKSHLLVLVGNTKRLWEPFLDQVYAELQANGKIERHPIDRYVEASVRAAMRQLESYEKDIPAPQVYWVAATTPSERMILAQQMAMAARAVVHCAGSQLCMHSTYGPWLAFRCALLFPIEGLEDLPVGTASCDHAPALEDVLKQQMDAALATVQTTVPAGTCIDPEVWKTWVLPRITMAPSHTWMYSSDQILYHYKKDLESLAKVARARALGLATDYLWSSEVPVHVTECRRVLQQVLHEIRESRRPTDRLAILLSGGLDTSIIAEATDQELTQDFFLDASKHDQAKPLLCFDHALVVHASEAAQDARYSRAIAERLEGISIRQHHVIQTSVDALLQEHTVEVCRILRSFDPMEIRNSLVIHSALKHAAALGVTHVMTGDGADEIFCGYSFFQAMDEGKLKNYRAHVMKIMQFSASRLAKALGIQVLSPYLDDRVKDFASSLTHKHQLIGNRTPVPVDGIDTFHGKLVLRQAFPEATSQWRSKEPIEQGAGTAALRMPGFFDHKWTDDAFAQEQARIWTSYGVYIRDKEHLYFFSRFLDAFDGDLKHVPVARSHDSSTRVNKTAFCAGCRFELSHVDQDFCVTCGHYPAQAAVTMATK